MGPQRPQFPAAGKAITAAPPPFDLAPAAVKAARDKVGAWENKTTRLPQKLTWQGGREGGDRHVAT